MEAMITTVDSAWLMQTTKTKTKHHNGRLNHNASFWAYVGF